MMRNLFTLWMYAALVPGWQFITQSHWFFFSHQFISQWSTPPSFCLHFFLAEWYMDELGRSSGFNNGSIGLAFDAVLRSNSNASHHHRRHTSDTGYGLLHARGHGSFKSCQNLTDRSRISPPQCRTAGNSTARLHLPLHVRPMSNLQASNEPSLPNLQPLRKSDGPPLPLDE